MNNTYKMMFLLSVSSTAVKFVATVLAAYIIVGLIKRELKKVINSNSIIEVRNER